MKLPGNYQFLKRYSCNSLYNTTFVEFFTAINTQQSYIPYIVNGPYDTIDISVNLTVWKCESQMKW